MHLFLPFRTRSHRRHVPDFYFRNGGFLLSESYFFGHVPCVGTNKHIKTFQSRCKKCSSRAFHSHSFRKEPRDDVFHRHLRFVGVENDRPSAPSISIVQKKWMSTSTCTTGLSCPSRRKLRLLCLHSFCTNAKAFEYQLRLAGWMDQLGDRVEFTFVDAPHVRNGSVPEDVRKAFPGPYYQWWDANEDGSIYHGAHVSFAYLRDVLMSRGPFDGLMGFSQGGTMAALLTLLQSRGQIFTSFEPFKCCVVIAGLPSRAKDHQKAYDGLPIGCPLLYVVGERDVLRTKSVILAHHFSNPTILFHPGGHIVPRMTARDLERCRDFFDQAMMSSLDNN